MRPDPQRTPPLTPQRSSRENAAGQLSEVSFIVMLFFVYAGGEPPAVNEAHYLSKAMHYWNPSWCPGDFFLESADAHVVFYWTVGWLTKFFSLSVTAWLGRLVIWTGLAWAWLRLCRAVVPGWGAALLSAALAMAGWHWGHLAGEWVIGGVEAKGLALVFLFLAMAQLARGSWTTPWIWLGVASAFHVLIGGWAVIAFAIVWLMEPRRRRLRLSKLAPWLLGGGLFALPGIVPALALTFGSDPSEAAEAATIYVYRRLSHHLVFHCFSWQRVISHGIALAIWTVFWSLTWRDERMNRIHRLVLGAIVIAAIGVLVDRLTWHDRTISAAVLRFYWFRLADVLVPMGIALSATWFGYQLSAAGDFREMRREVATARSLYMAVLLVVATACPMNVFLQRRADPRPEAIVQNDRQASALKLNESYWDWRDVCEWFRTSTPVDALTLTPTGLQTFRWYAGRGEVYSWKDIPQGVTGILQWQRRRDLVRATQLYEGQAQDIDFDAVQRLVEDVGFRYLIVPANVKIRQDGFQLQLQNASFAVYTLAKAP